MKASLLPKVMTAAEFQQWFGRKRSLSGGHRQERGVMNETEARFQLNYLELRKRNGEIIDYGYERVVIDLAPGRRCTLTIDFDAKFRDGRIAYFDTKWALVNKKGKSRPKVADDAIIKLKITAALFPKIDVFLAWETRPRSGDFILRKI